MGEPPDRPASGTDGPAVGASGRGVDLDVRLIGRLPCVFCGYELQGLSIRGQCPECGAAVRATILHRVDPEADEFAPVARPWLLASGLVLWPAGGLLVCAAGWLSRGLELLRQQGGLVVSWPPLTNVGLAGVAASMVGGLLLIRPTSETARWKVATALAGCAAYGPMLWAHRRISVLDASDWRAYTGPSPDAERAVLRLILGASLIALCLGLRPVARDLVRRSMALRTGRVDRQALLLIVAAGAVAMAGDALRLASAASGDSLGASLATVGTPLVGLGSMLVTIGLVGALVDGLRIGRAVVQPPPSIRDVVGDRG